MAEGSLLARKYVDGIYIPVGLLVVGTAIVKREWTAYALLLGVALGAIKYFNTRRTLLCPRPLHPQFPPADDIPPVPKKVLKPDVFQEFELKEKTIISHNVAM
jgi:cytochrome-b5 reductase